MSPNRRTILATAVFGSVSGCLSMFDDETQLGGVVLLNQIDEGATIEVRVTVDDEEAYTETHSVESGGDLLLSPAWPTKSRETILEVRHEGEQEWLSGRVGDEAISSTDDTCVIGYVYLFDETSTLSDYIEFRPNRDELPSDFQC